MSYESEGRLDSSSISMTGSLFLISVPMSVKRRRLFELSSFDPVEADGTHDCPHNPKSILLAHKFRFSLMSFW